jgi:hypothetical protein
MKQNQSKKVKFIVYIEYLGKNCGRNVARSLLNSVLFYANCDREPLYNERIIKLNKL